MGPGMKELGEFSLPWPKTLPEPARGRARSRRATMAFPKNLAMPTQRIKRSGGVTGATAEGFFWAISPLDGGTRFVGRGTGRKKWPLLGHHLELAGWEISAVCGPTRRPVGGPRSRTRRALEASRTPACAMNHVRARARSMRELPPATGVAEARRGRHPWSKARCSAVAHGRDRPAGHRLPDRTRTSGCRYLAPSL